MHLYTGPLHLETTVPLYALLAQVTETSEESPSQRTPVK